MSSLGKGLAAASIGCLLECRGLKVTIQKLDPYINVDPGTMNPFQHGEVYVTDDEGDLTAVSVTPTTWAMSVLWTYRASDAASHGVAFTPGGDLIYFSDDDDTLYAVARIDHYDMERTTSFDAGDLVWSVSVGTITATPVIHAGCVYVPYQSSGTDYVKAVYLDAGTVKWTRSLGSNSGSTMPSLVPWTGTTLCAVDSDGDTYKIKTSDGTNVASMVSATSTIYAPPILSNGNMILMNHDGTNEPTLSKWSGTASASGSYDLAGTDYCYSPMAMGYDQASGVDRTYVLTGDGKLQMVR